MNKLIQLKEKCKAGIYLFVNEHIDYYQSVDDYLKQNIDYEDIIEETPDDIMRRMVETDTIIQLTFYPHTPIGSITIYHYDIEEALDEALKYFDK